MTLKCRNVFMSSHLEEKCSRDHLGEHTHAGLMKCVCVYLKLALGIVLLCCTVLQSESGEAESTGVALVQPSHPVRLVMDVVSDVLQVLKVGPAEDKNN